MTHSAVHVTTVDVGSPSKSSQPKEPGSTLGKKKNALNNLLPWMNSSPGGMSKGFGVQVPTPAVLSMDRKCWVGLERHLVRSPCSKAGV